jgi:hypothetical protein
MRKDEQMIEKQKKAGAQVQAGPLLKAAEYTTQLRDYVQTHKRSGRLFPWEVAERLFVIQQVLGEGSAEFGASMKNLGSLKKGGVGVPEKTGYRYLRSYKASIAALPQPVIEALFAENILPSKQSILDGVAGNNAIQTELNTIRAAIEQKQTQFIPGLCSAVVTRIRDATKRKAVPGLPPEMRSADALCRRFKLLISDNDLLFPKLFPTGRTKTSKPEDVKAARRALYYGSLMAFQRCGLFPKSDVASDAALSELQTAWLDSQRDIEQLIAEMLPDREI